VWPLAPEATSSYSVYEDSGVSVDYQHGVFTRTHIKATQTGDTLKVEIGPVEGSFVGMLKARGFEVRLPADWPPASVTVNGAPVKHFEILGKGGWTFEGNTLTTVIPVASRSTAERVTVEVRRAAGLTARRGELDGFAGTMTRLRGAYDATNVLWPVVGPPDVLVDAMQTGDRLSYHPEFVQEEIAHYHVAILEAQAAVKAINTTFADSLAQNIKRISAASFTPEEVHAQQQRHIDAFQRAQQLVTIAGK